MRADFDFTEFVRKTKSRFEVERRKDLEIIYTPERLPFTEEMQNFIKTSWNKAKQKWSGMYNDKLYHVKQRDYSQSSIVLQTVDSDYREYVGTRKPRFGKLFGTSYVVNPLSIGLLVVTSDDKILIGKRKFVDTWEGFYSTVAGYVQYPKKPKTQPDLNETISKELFQEVAIVSGEILDTNFLGSNGGSYLIYEIKVAVPYLELASRKPSEIEFASIEYVQSTGKPLKLFINANKSFIMPGCLTSLIYFGLQHFGKQWGSKLTDVNGLPA